MQSLTLKNFLGVNISVGLPLFEGSEGDIFVRSSPYANLKGPEFRATVTTKMGRFDQVNLCLGVLEREDIALVAEARTLCGLWPL